jgi:hypothetical protein
MGSSEKTEYVADGSAAPSHLSLPEPELAIEAAG